MAILEVLQFPDERLRLLAEPVLHVDDSIRQLAADLVETMYADNGAGLAATQVNVQKQVIVMDVSDTRNQPQVFINPQIIAHEGVKVCEEGCLSVPGYWADVERFAWIKVQALDVQGEPFIVEAENLFSRCLQHEMDHLKGRLFVDYLSPLKRDRVRKKMEKQRKLNI